MYIEDLIDRLSGEGKYMFAKPLAVHTLDRTIVSSLATQATAYTEKQRGLAVKLVTKYEKQLSAELKLDILSLISVPLFKNNVRVLGETKSITIRETEGNKYFSVKFPFNQAIVEAIKEHKKVIPHFESQNIVWDQTDREWRLGLTEINVMFLSELANEFTCDPTFLNYLAEIKEIESNIDQYVPMVNYENGKFVYKNVVSKIPQPTSTDLIDILIDARKYGIQCWDDAIDNALQSTVVNKNLQTIFKSTPGKPVVLDNGNLQDLLAFIENGTTLFVLPGGAELEHLRSVHNFLNEKGYTNEQLSVLFRLDNIDKNYVGNVTNAGKTCNDYIKGNKLNNMLSETTKCAFISGKLTKAILESPIKIDTVIHFGTNSAHYTLRNYVKNHHNVISFTLTNKNMEIPFGNLQNNIER